MDGLNEGCRRIWLAGVSGSTELGDDLSPVVIEVGGSLASVELGHICLPRRRRPYPRHGKAKQETLQGAYLSIADKGSDKHEAANEVGSFGSGEDRRPGTHFSASSGGLLSALILLAGIPGSLLGGYWADRSQNLRMFVVGPLIVVAVLLTLIPVVPNGALWELGIGIGFFLIFGFAAWLAVPARVCNIEHQYIGTATGVMLTLAAIGGFFIPIIFGHLVPHTSFDTGWIFLAVLSFAFAIVGLAGHNPASATQGNDGVLVSSSVSSTPSGPA